MVVSTGSTVRVSVEGSSVSSGSMTNGGVVSFVLDQSVVISSSSAASVVEVSILSVTVIIIV